MSRLKTLLVPVAVDWRGSLALLILRVVAGLALMLHGRSKIENPFHWMGADSSMPGFLQALAALSEFGGGFGLILGLLTPVCAFGIGCTMAFAVYRHAIQKGDPFVGKGGYELASLYLAISLVMLLVGPGRLSIDAWLKRGAPR